MMLNIPNWSRFAYALYHESFLFIAGEKELKNCLTESGTRRQEGGVSEGVPQKCQAQEKIVEREGTEERGATVEGDSTGSHPYPR